MSFSSLFDIHRWTLAGVAWSFGLAVAMLVVSLAVVAFILVQISPTHFLDDHQEDRWAHRHPALRWSVLVLKNLVGLALIIAGVLMLVGPGQGVLTILVGLMLMSIPGKRRLERKIVGRRHILSAINWLRANFGKPPLVVSETGG